MKSSVILEIIYKKLLKAFHHRNWWPGDTADEIIIGAILTQNVSWNNVEKAIENLKQHNLCTIEQIHHSNMEKITPHIRSTFYFNEKAKKLKNFTEFLYTHYNGDVCKMFQTTTWTLRKQLLQIKGIGEETADSILLYAGEKPVFVIDAYTKRIFSRIGLTKPDWSYTEYQQFFMENLPEDIGLYNDFHAQIVNLGKSICRIKPLCDECPLNNFCEKKLIYLTKKNYLK
ncbi:MAG: endonuclease III domain-containing protein [Candidatus Cloacimonetes bacterium]|nr:endonuclease III domain-containing protein [Candidatus Cloacimonadota bacterium]